MLFVNGQSFLFPSRALDSVRSFTEQGSIAYPGSPGATPDARLLRALCEMYNAGLISPAAPGPTQAS